LFSGRLSGEKGEQVGKLVNVQWQKKTTEMLYL